MQINHLIEELQLLAAHFGPDLQVEVRTPKGEWGTVRNARFLYSERGDDSWSIKISAEEDKFIP